MNDLVSIIMPSYNTGKYIGQSIESVIKQTYKNWELIIVDDYSTDNTEKIIKAYLADKRIKYYKNMSNIGAAETRNYALRKAKGKWIAFLDSDDIWSKDKLEKQIKFMVDNNYNFSYTCYQEIDDLGYLGNKIITGPKKITRLGMYLYCWPGCLTVMYNQDFIGLIQINDLEKNNDYALWLSVIEKCKECHLLDFNLALYRKRVGSISNINKFKLIKYHYLLFHEGQNLNIFKSGLLTIGNIIFGIIKKCKYNKKMNGKRRD